MKCKSFTLETDGTSSGTKIFVDGKQIGLVQKFEFSADVEENFVKISLQQGVALSDGSVKTKKQKVRDEKTQKFEEKEVAVTEAILIEFERN